MTDYIDSYGTALKVGDAASPEVFTTIPKLTKLGPIQLGSGKPLRDVTDLADAVRQHKKGIADMKEIVCEGFYDPNDTVHASLQTDDNNGTRRNFQIALASSPAYTLQFTALVMIESAEVAVDTDVPMTLTLKPQTVLSEV